MPTAAFVLSTTAGCGSREAEARRAAGDALTGVTATLAGLPRDRWARPPAEVRQRLELDATVYRILGPRPDGSVGLAVWQVDTGADPFTDDTPRTGMACARVDGGARGTAVTYRPEPCPPGLPIEVDGAALDWSEASPAYEAALLAIGEALSRTQRQVQLGRVRTPSAAAADLRRQGLTVRVARRDDPSTLYALVRARATAPRLGDPGRTAVGATCSMVSVSVARSTPFYSNTNARPC